MSQFCSLDEAFGPVVAQPGKKTKKPVHRKEGEEPTGVEGFVPSQLPTGPAGMDPDRPAARPGPAPPAMQAVAASGVRLEAGSGAQEFFPLPGETAQPDEWAKAFMLEPSQTTATIQPSRYRGPSAIREAVAPAPTPVPVNGLPTLWRDASAAVGVPITDISARLDTLTKQLDSLTTPTPMQSTAELFLFVAIGLLILLAIDSILRFATAMVSRNSSSQRGGFLRRGSRWHHT